MKETESERESVNARETNERAEYVSVRLEGQWCVTKTADETETVTKLDRDHRENVLRQKRKTCEREQQMKAERTWKTFGERKRPAGMELWEQPTGLITADVIAVWMICSGISHALHQTSLLPWYGGSCPVCQSPSCTHTHTHSGLPMTIYPSPSSPSLRDTCWTLTLTFTTCMTSALNCDVSTGKQPLMWGLWTACAKDQFL